MVDYGWLTLVAGSVVADIIAGSDVADIIGGSVVADIIGGSVVVDYVLVDSSWWFCGCC